MTEQEGGDGVDEGRRRESSGWARGEGGGQPRVGVVRSLEWKYCLRPRSSTGGRGRVGVRCVGGRSETPSQGKESVPGGVTQVLDGRVRKSWWGEVLHGG